MAGVLFTRAAPAARLPLAWIPGARRCRIWAAVGVWGVGASGSTIASTNVCWANEVSFVVKKTCGRSAFSRRIYAQLPCQGWSEAALHSRSLVRFSPGVTLTDAPVVLSKNTTFNIPVGLNAGSTAVPSGSHR